ncbi:uncharacterized protein LOC131378641 [Hirundo rustica]|uniref:uncharacterized protein LOC131378641 n=1 Tax=Hirundo rustica TaxID=43150 RepID=UPI00267315BC|nr:uncharacterized protein LOC131378641 [Hirundo rustica]
MDLFIPFGIKASNKGQGCQRRREEHSLLGQKRLPAPAWECGAPGRAQEAAEHRAHLEVCPPARCHIYLSRTRRCALAPCSPGSPQQDQALCPGSLQPWFPSAGAGAVPWLPAALVPLSRTRGCALAPCSPGSPQQEQGLFPGSLQPWFPSAGAGAVPCFPAALVPLSRSRGCSLAPCSPGSPQQDQALCPGSLQPWFPSAGAGAVPWLPAALVPLSRSRGCALVPLSRSRRCSLAPCSPGSPQLLSDPRQCWRGGLCRPSWAQGQACPRFSCGGTDQAVVLTGTGQQCGGYSQHKHEVSLCVFLVFWLFPRCFTREQQRVKKVVAAVSVSFSPLIFTLFAQDTQ